jgi:hypothetical protein
MGKTGKRFWKFFWLNLVISLLLSGLIWKFVLGKTFNLHRSYIEIDFFNTVGVVFTIIGLMIALYQIAELRTRQEIIAEANRVEKERTFRLNALERYSGIKEKAEGLQKRITKERSFTAKGLNEYIELLSDCINSLNTILEYQNSLKSDPVIDCDKCVTLLSEIRVDACKVVEESSYASFKKQTFIGKLGEALKIMSAHEAKLKS